MSLTLKNFKRAIPATILARGRDHYASGNVVDLSLDGDDTWIAEVQGTEPYEVTIEQRPDGSLACNCTCPYEYGEHCKHVAAVLYAVEEAFPEYFEGARRKPARKRATRMDRLRAALQAIPPDQLVGILLELAKGDRNLQTQLLLHLDPGRTVADYRRLVKDTVRPLRSNHGFVDHSVASRVSRQLDELFGRAEQTLNAHPDDATALYQTLFEETMALAGQVDDSNGVLADAIPRALEGLAACARRLSPDGRATLLAYCLREVTEPRQQGWGYGWGLLELAAGLVETPAQRDALDAALEAMQPTGKRAGGDSYLRGYYAERAAEVKLIVVQRLDGDEAMLAFINDHRHLPSFREHLIEFHIARGDLATARQLAEEGVALARKGNNNIPPRQILGYRDLILQIALQQGDVRTVIEHARELWLRRCGEPYYDLLTDAVPPDQWPDFRERLLNDRNCAPDLAAWAYAREGMWPEVRDIALADRRLLKEYQLEIEARFPHETAAAYRRIVEKLLSDVSDRVTYREAAGYLVRMQKLGHGDEGRALARAYIEKYPQRRAMIEELKRAAG